MFCNLFLRRPVHQLQWLIFYYRQTTFITLHMEESNGKRKINLLTPTNWRPFLRNSFQWRFYYSSSWALEYAKFVGKQISWQHFINWNPRLQGLYCPFIWNSKTEMRLFDWLISAYLDLFWLISSHKILFILPAEQPNWEWSWFQDNCQFPFAIASCKTSNDLYCK
jgi:hypothetical protein